MNRWDVIGGLLCGRNPKLGAEIGVKEGRFLYSLLSRYQDLTMYAVDPWEEQPEGNETYSEWNFPKIYNEYKQKTKGFKDRVIEIRDYSETAHKIVMDGSLDFVFIDAQHDFASVKQDISLWAPKVKCGGLLAGHDYNHVKFPGVVKAVHGVCNPNLGDNDVWYTWI